MEMVCPIATATKETHQPKELKQDFSFHSREEAKEWTPGHGINSLGEKGYLRTEWSHRSSLSILPGTCKRSLRKKMIKVVLKKVVLLPTFVWFLYRRTRRQQRYSGNQMIAASLLHCQCYWQIKVSSNRGKPSIARCPISTIKGCLRTFPSSSVLSLRHLGTTSSSNITIIHQDSACVNTHIVLCYCACVYINLSTNTEHSLLLRRAYDIEVSGFSHHFPHYLSP